MARGAAQSCPALGAIPASSAAPNMLHAKATEAARLPGHPRKPSLPLPSPPGCQVLLCLASLLQPYWPGHWLLRLPASARPSQHCARGPPCTPQTPQPLVIATPCFGGNKGAHCQMGRRAGIFAPAPCCLFMPRHTHGFHRRSWLRAREGQARGVPPGDSSSCEHPLPAPPCLAP